MCGIVGYVGKREAYPILIKGLKRLEYRGYDSAGVALISDSGELNVYKQKGKVADLEQYTADKDCSGQIGMAHTRWATHGVPSQINAHPHVSQSGRFALVHNGIIENYADLRKQLEEKGFTFKSETDTEVLVQLIEYTYNAIAQRGGQHSGESLHRDILSAIRLTLRKVVGAYALVLIDRNDPDAMFCARKASPLVVGLGEGEYFVASDATPIVEYTDQVIYLNDGEIALLRRGKDIKIINLENLKVPAEIQTIDMDIDQLEKGGYEHFMLKEIYEQPRSIRNCMSGRVSPEGVVLSAVRDNKERLLRANRYIIVACGTSWHAALIGKHLIEHLCRIPVTVEYASEFRYADPVLTGDEVLIAISQSGETADTLAAIDLAKRQGAFIFGICNVVGSSIPRATDTGCYIHVGPEIGVASTKAFTGQVTTLAMLALCLAREYGTCDPQEYSEILTDLQRVPDLMERVLTEGPDLAPVASIFTYARNFIYLGRGYNYPVALEGALKLKEISYIHAEGYPAAEMKHGPIALIDEEMPVVFIATRNFMYEKVVSNMAEVKARKGRIIAIVSEGEADAVAQIADICIPVPCIHECLEPLLTTLPLQLLAYHIAVCRGLNVDQPRNLAKSVTVE